MRCLERKGFTRPVVQSLHDGGDILPADLSKVHSFREVLPDKSVRVFIQSTFPRVVRLGEITLAIETFIDQFVLRKLPAVVVRDRLHPLLVGQHQPHDFHRYIGGVLPLHLADQR